MIAYDKIFLIDDDPVYRLIAGKLLTKSEFFNTVEYFVNGQEGINALKEIIEQDGHLPGAIFLDIEMPIMSGWQFMDEFSRLPNECRDLVNVFIVTSSIADEDIKKAQQYPVIKKYISKPLTNETLSLVSKDLSLISKAQNVSFSENLD